MEDIGFILLKLSFCPASTDSLVDVLFEKEEIGDNILILKVFPGGWIWMCKEKADVSSCLPFQLYTFNPFKRKAREYI